MKNITLGHGSGGKLSQDLIKNIFLKKFGNSTLNNLEDAAVIAGRHCFTTDSYVVRPLFFPGGDIGKLAVCGTVNDLAVMGAKPLAVSVAMIIEEGLDVEVLEKIAGSISEAAREAGVSVVTGDTKVVEKGKADKIFINTSGVGIMRCGIRPSASKIRPGDKLIINGTLGDHSIAILSARGELGFEAQVKSDCAPLSGLIQDILKASKSVRFMRDLTRGGLATVLNEVAENAAFGISINEKDIPLNEATKAGCELLGFDPLYLANEGKIAIFVPEKHAQRVLAAMRKNTYGKNAQVIGEATTDRKGKVILNTLAGGRRIVDMPVADQLPRIC